MIPVDHQWNWPLPPFEAYNQTLHSAWRDDLSHKVKILHMFVVIVVLFFYLSFLVCHLNKRPEWSTVAICSSGVLKSLVLFHPCGENFQSFLWLWEIMHVFFYILILAQLKQVARVNWKPFSDTRPHILILDFLQILKYSSGCVQASHDSLYCSAYAGFGQHFEWPSSVLIQVSVSWTLVERCSRNMPKKN